MAVTYAQPRQAVKATRRATFHRSHDQGSLAGRATRPRTHVRHRTRHLWTLPPRRGPSIVTVAGKESITEYVDTQRSPQRLHHSRPTRNGRALRAERDEYPRVASHYRRMAPKQARPRPHPPRQRGFQVSRPLRECGSVGRVDASAGPNARALKNHTERAHARMRPRPLQPLQRHAFSAPYSPCGGDYWHERRQQLPLLANQSLGVPIPASDRGGSG